ncbi:MAG TPA: type II toxin-antitoxin system VapC family toxin [Roseiarcus sp.]
MSDLVVDASVALCWFAAEDGTPAAKQLVRSAVELIAPTMLLAELANALWKKTRRGELEGEVALEAMREVRRFVPEFVDIAELVGPAFVLARELGHPVYDCVYLVLARKRQIRFATLDRVFVDKVAATPYGRDVVHLSDWS